MTRADGAVTSMRLEAFGAPLVERVGPLPAPARDQILVRVLACAVCRTDLHVVDGELERVRLPVVPGHEVVGRVEAAGAGVEFAVGTRVGVPWLAWTCGRCAACARGDENLCEAARFTGHDVDGGFATHVLADARYAFALPDAYGDEEVAPLLCAGLIGYRAWQPCRGAVRLGLYGFGAAAHIAVQVARAAGQEVFAFVRAGDAAAMAFARRMGAVWAGDALGPPPAPLDAAILFAPAGELVPAALAAVRPGGTVVCGGIHMSDIPSFPYRLLWGERTLRSIANLTRRDAAEFLAVAARTRIATVTRRYPLARANDALADLRAGRFEGAAVLVPA